MKLSSGDTLVERKVVLLGSSTVGKTSILNRLMRDSYTAETVTTIGSGFKTKTIQVGDTYVKMQIWDTGGHERFRSLAPMYFHDADAAIIVYDITSQQSFEEVEYWFHDLIEKGPTNLVIALAGNKSDLANLRAVSTTNGSSYADKHCIQIFMETSALSGENITEIFTDIAANISTNSPSQRKKGSFPPERKEKCSC
ncbi:small GTP-binding protein [Tritrichomonas foetus]|uniref:Small GTP-binding protein n=1 Tax=Tritrichomonas foetus TaxID=1144522 RepID=A0A1J4KNS0_9EUKA|nr:small GTP-binding protein [Tritrichomonas foetus]|eukprot:OHT12935.1 small GTP-binding protein [Tritrichomonas foetus]